MKVFGAMALIVASTLLASPIVAAARPQDDRARQDERAKQDRKALKQRDHDAARRAVLRREVLPLPRILAMVADYQRGDVIEIELKNKDGVLVYDVDVLVPTGTVRELRVDARSGKLLTNVAKGE